MPHMLRERAMANTTDVFGPMEKFTSGGSMLNLQPSTYCGCGSGGKRYESPSATDVGNRSGADSVGDCRVGNATAAPARWP